MKRFALLPLLALAFHALFSQHPILYVNFVSHNEPYDGLHNTFNYTKQKLLCLQLADMVVAEDARWNLGTCDGFVTGAMNVDGAAGANVFRTLAGATYNGHVEIDPRNKNFTTIADLVYNLDSVGANPSHNLSGFIWWSSDTAKLPDWFEYQVPDTGITYPGFTWQADIIWGPGSISPHSNDYNDYGVWKPDTVDRFGDHNPDRHLWTIGNGCQPLYSLDSAENEQVVIDLLQGVVDSLQNDLWPQDKFYCYTITINQSEFGPMLFGKLQKVMDSLNAIGSDKLAWATLSEKKAAFDIWAATHADHSQWLCGETMSAVDPGQVQPSLSLFPNPFQSMIRLQSHDGRPHQVSVLNALGQQVFEESLVSELEIETSNWPAGLYWILCDGKWSAKAAKQ
jgi:hypothetical protein